MQHGVAIPEVSMTDYTESINERNVDYVCVKLLQSKCRR